jgi:hypothetical protein
MPEIHRWQYQYLGLSTFPKTLSVVELRAFFTFNEAELGAIRSRRKAALRVAAAIQLGFLKMTGCPLAAVRVIPARLLRHVALQLDTEPISIATLRTIYERSKTLYEHQWWAMQILGFEKATPAQLKPLTPYLTNEAKYASTVDQLVERAKLWVYQNRFISLGERDLRDRARRAMGESLLGLLQLIREQLPPHEQRRWESQLLRLREGSSQTTLEWLQQPPRRKSINALRERQERIAFLKGLGVDKLDLDVVPIEKIRAYAAQMHGMRPAKFRELADPTRSVRLVCHLKIALMQASDAAIMLASRQIAKIVRSAYDGARTLEAKTSLGFREVVEEIFDLADDAALSDAAFRDAVRKLKKGCEAPQFPTRAAAARWILSEPTPAVRALLSELNQLDLQGEEGNESATRMGYLRNLYQRKQTALPTEPGIPTPKGWKDLIEGEDRERAMRALEAATLVGLRKSLRSGAVFVDHSEKFRGRHRLLIDDARWKKERGKRYAQLSPGHCDIPSTIRAADILTWEVTISRFTAEDILG